MINFKRSYLLLQGVCSAFFSRLADSLKAEGHLVTKVNFNGGDLAYSGSPPAVSFRASVDLLSDFLEQLFSDFKVTDIVLFGDRRPVHRPAVELAQSKGIRIHVFEEGYFRPAWVTLERGGVNAHSRLPRDPDWYLDTARKLNNCPVEHFKSRFRIRALHDVLYHLVSMANPVFFPGYQTHAHCIAPVMYAGYIKRFAKKPFNEWRDNAFIESLVSSRVPYYLLPLQLNSDAQIRDHSDFEHMYDVIEYVMESFARNAPSDSRLVIKNHPLDMGLENYPERILKFAKDFDLIGRVDYLETGNLELLVKYAAGTVTVNSTVGGVALQYDCPTVTLSNPIYNMPGLTFQGSLDQFWNSLQIPDRELFLSFKTSVIHATQVNGGFYCNEGIVLAVKNSISRLTADRSPLEELL